MTTTKPGSAGMVVMLLLPCCLPDPRFSAGRADERLACAFDLIEHHGDDLRDLPLIDRKRRLARLLGRALVAMRRQLE